MPRRHRIIHRVPFPPTSPNLWLTFARLCVSRHHTLRTEQFLGAARDGVLVKLEAGDWKWATANEATALRCGDSPDTLKV